MMDMNNGILKVVRSLAAKKYRDDEGLFVAEGTKCVRDTWQHFNCRWLIAKRSWYDIDENLVASSLNIVLDNIQDPGNLGTIIRLADWFGIRDIFASKTSVDVYNHKVVQATMGAIARVKVHYGDLEALFEKYPDLTVYGTFLDGKNIYTSELGKQGFVVFGNEGQGIGAKVAKHVDSRLLIPKAKTAGSESLNVGVAAAITISEFFRR